MGGGGVFQSSKYNVMNTESVRGMDGLQIAGQFHSSFL